MVWPRGDVESGEKDILESDQTCIVRPKSKKRGPPSPQELLSSRCWSGMSSSTMKKHQKESEEICQQLNRQQMQKVEKGG